MIETEIDDAIVFRDGFGAPVYSWQLPDDWD